MWRLAVCLMLLCCSFSAWAGGIAVVDFQRALTEIKEGKKIEAELNTLMQQKQSEVQQMQMNLQKWFLCGIVFRNRYAKRL